MKQKHEKFEAFNDIQAANEFLSKGHIHPKSISTSLHYSNSDFITLFFIGYSENKKDHHYHIEKFEISESTIFFVGMVGAMKEVEEKATLLGGVVCQDISLSGGGLTVYFLVANKEEKED